jgi:ATP-binding cassette subfamily A (ABC1) protein 5
VEKDNVLFDNLTVREHLTLFGRLKHPKDSNREIVERVAVMIDSIGLRDKADSFASELSGGMKRKLCLGIALIGDPKGEIFLNALHLSDSEFCSGVH